VVSQAVMFELSASPQVTQCADISLVCELAAANLKPEIRNRIYEFLVQDVPNGWDRQSNRKDTSSEMVSGLRMLDWTHLRRQDLGLTQTCRLFRNEYLPIYNQEPGICIPLQRLVEAA
jgi:hypothetical protein